MGDYAHIRGHVTLKEELLTALAPRFTPNEDNDFAPWESLDLPEAITETEAFRFLCLSSYGDWVPSAMSSAIPGFRNSPYGEEDEAAPRTVLEGRGLDFYACFKDINTQYAFIALLPHIAEDWHVELDWHEFMMFAREPRDGWTEWDSSKDRSVADAEAKVRNAMPYLNALTHILGEEERTARQANHPNVGTVGHIDHGKARGMTPYVIHVDSLSFLPKMDDGRVVVDTSNGWGYAGHPPLKGPSEKQRTKNKAKRKQQAKSRKRNRK